MTTKVFGLGMKANATGAIDLDTDTFKALLAASGYTPNQDTHDFRDDVTNEVANGSGYVTGGVALSGVAVTYDSASQQVRFDCNDISWTFTASKTWRNAIVYKSRGGASSADELFGYLVWDSDQSVSTAYTLQIDPAGLFFIDVT